MNIQLQVCFKANKILKRPSTFRRFAFEACSTYKSPEMPKVEYIFVPLPITPGQGHAKGQVLMSYGVLYIYIIYVCIYIYICTYTY